LRDFTDLTIHEAVKQHEARRAMALRWSVARQ